MATNGIPIHTKGATVPFHINGQDVVASKTFDVVNPATGKAVHKCSSATEADAKAAVDAAAKALPAWKAMVPTKRREVFLKAAEVLEKRRDELATTMVEEVGVPRAWADFNLGVAKDLILDVAGRLVTIEGTIPTPQDPNTGALVLKEPYGVVMAIAPWNAPYILGSRSVIFPIAAGNTAVFKASELSPKTHWGICSVFAEAGLPAGVLNMIVHEPANAAAITSSLIANEHIKKINFTGSTMVGRIIGKLAGEQLKPVLLELGGKAPAIVWDDANLDLAADQCALGAFLNSGQVCMSTERVIVHKAVKDEFEKKFLASIDKFFPSAGDAPVLIHQPAVEKTKKLLKDAKDKGATLLNGDFEAQESTPTRLRPIVVKGIKEDMDLYKTESFGPTVALFEVDSEEEALRLANDTEYGLTSAVFTEDLRRGLRFAKGIETGACHINSMSIHDESALPHGGAKSSGYGRFNSIGLDEWVRTKTVTYRY
ncbi:ldehyde dehydrogenase [Diaporthe amygdali]|uniref:ldehyde dehydrogenase n=1 Tax=Phomopsis amygdali TaxID=1214568 RepID=UPI0022FE5B1E|nr:ldehyde dehydrogenase [Diaporthe amygdali]KAJ0122746.1 ldehyde dehydrogenase [Diaporthe amygdali]